MNLKNLISAIRAIDLQAVSVMPLSPDEYDLVQKVQRMPADTSFLLCAREPGHDGACEVGTVADGVSRCECQAGKLPENLLAQLEGNAS